MLISELEHALRQRGRKQHGLARFGLRQATQDEADVGNEAEVEHAVRFVEHHGLRMAHVEDVLLEVIDDAARRADQDVDAILQALALLFVVDATIYDTDLEPGVLAQHFRVVEDLDRELARGRQDERADARRAAPRRRRVGQQPLIQRDEERGGLAGAGLRLPGDILARERNRQSACLDRGGADETRIRNAACDFRDEIE